jgi:transketolase
MAIAERYLAARFNRPGYDIVDHYTFGIVSDGDLMEGVSHEAASLAGHLRLGKLIYLYDDNRISIEGSTDITFSEDRMARFKAYGWHVQEVSDGNDLVAIEKALAAAEKESRRPSIISVSTHIGYGSPSKQDTAGVHGEPLGPEELARTKENLKWPSDPPFFIPDEATNYFRQALQKGKALESEWQSTFNAYAEQQPEKSEEWHRWFNEKLPENWDQDITPFDADLKGIATRVASGTVLNAIAPRIANLIGGSADLAPSTKTLIKDEKDFQAGQYAGRNMRFGVREHAMGSILNGMALHGGLKPYGATFLVFSDYMRPAIRLAALTNLDIIYVFTHDSIGLGEDGPTHQPVEHLAALRAIPNLTVIRPCDANETIEAWRFAVENKQGPVALILTRQNIPTLDRTIFTAAEGLHRGAYTLRDSPNGKPEIIFMASGSEIHIALQAADQMARKKISARVVSMPSWEIFERQPEAYRRNVLPPETTARIAIEAGSPQGWHRYVGSKGEVVALDHFGASAPYQTLYEKFGLTADRVVEKAMALLS